MKAWQRGIAEVKVFIASWKQRERNVKGSTHEGDKPFQAPSDLHLPARLHFLIASHL